MEKKLTFKKKGVVHTPLNFWELSDGNIVSIYQGSRGDNPELDFVVKYLAPNKRLRAPSHTHWIVDLLVKADNNREFVRNYITTWIDRYDTIEPFKDITERNNYVLVYSTMYETSEYEQASKHGYYSVQFISTLLELFIKCEKQTKGAYMFRTLMGLVKEYCEGKKDFYQIISYSKRV